MNKDQTAIPIRLSKNHLSVIFQGLDFIAAAWRTREQTGTSPYSYPFRLYPLAPGHDIGTLSPAMMNRISALRSRLSPKAKTGGRDRLNSFEVRIAILASRVPLAFRRKQAREMQRRDAESKRRLGVDKDSIAKLQKQTRAAIKSLEKAMKSADRHFQKQVSKEGFQNQSKEWKSHLRWMRYNLLYFKPLPRVLPGYRSRQRKQIDQLVMIAEAGLKDQGYEFPSKKDLRSMMRRFARYSRRGRMGEFDHRYVLENPAGWNTQSAVVDFLEKQLDLKPVPDEPVTGPKQLAQAVPALAKGSIPEDKPPGAKPKGLMSGWSPARKARWDELMKNRPNRSFRPNPPK